MSQLPRTMVFRVSVYAAAFFLACALIRPTWGIVVGAMIGLQVGAAHELPVGTMQQHTADVLRAANWCLVATVVSAIVFGLVGMLITLATRLVWMNGAVPVMSLLVCNPLVHFPYARDLPLGEKAVVFLLGQVVACWLGGYAGAYLVGLSHRAA
jgi:hypothetical protein